MNPGIRPIRARGEESICGANLIQNTATHVLETPNQSKTHGARSRRGSRLGLGLFIAIGWSAIQNPALGSYHFMQIEQVIGGVNGNTAAQAIQLRMRVNAQNILNKASLYAVDAAGQNPVLLIDFTTDLSGAEAGDRVLAVTADFVRYTSPEVQADYILTAAIPASYLAAGSLIFENDEGTLLAWRLSWGGSGYTGDTTAALTNDDDREFGPPVAGPLPSEDLRALLFQGDTSAKSNNNLADYALTADPVVFTNNGGATFTVTALNCPNDPDGDADNDGVCGDVDNCPAVANGDQNDGDGDGVGTACDECPEDGAKSAAGICGCGVADDDRDEDGAADCNDNCPQDANEDQADADEDGAGDACDGCPDDPEFTVAAFCETPLDDNDNTDDGSDDGTTDDGSDGGTGGADDGDSGTGTGSGSIPRPCGAGMIGLLAIGCMGLVRISQGLSSRNRVISGSRNVIR